MTRMYKDGSTKKGKKFYHCGSCDSVVDEKHLSNHSKDSISYLFAVDEEDKERRVDELQESDEHLTDEDKERERKKRFEADKAEARKLSSQERDEEIKRLQLEIDEIKGKTDTKSAKRKRYDVLGYQHVDFDTKVADCFLEELGSTD